jgi:selenocysteine lyase/cysteine desulfurase
MDIEPLAGGEYFPATSKFAYLNADDTHPHPRIHQLEHFADYITDANLLEAVVDIVKLVGQKPAALQYLLALDFATGVGGQLPPGVEEAVNLGRQAVVADADFPLDLGQSVDLRILIAVLGPLVVDLTGEEENIVGVDVVFPSTIYPWLRVAHTTGCEIRLLPTTDYYADPEELVGLIDENTAVVAISHVEFGSGQRYDLQRLAEVAHSHGALLAVDATQSAGAIPIDVSRDGIDILVAAGYKWLCGPFGAAVMYVAPHLQTRFEPGLAGFRSHTDMWDLRADRIQYRDDAGRFEFGTMAYGCALALAEAIKFILSLGVDAVCAHDFKLRTRLAEGLKQRGAQLLSPVEDTECSPIVSARFAGFSSRRLVDKLKERGVIVSPRADFVRFSPHLYNSSDDIDQALDSLDRALAS